MAAATLDTDLATNVKKALKREPTKPMFFAFVMKGGTDGKLIVSKAKVQPKQIAEAKKETGGSAVLKGVCFGENGTLVFEMARPVAPNVAGVTKNVLKAKAGLTCKVEYRLGRDEEAVAESAEPDLPSGDAGEAVPAADGAAQPSESDYLARVKELSEDLKKAITSGTPAGNEAKLRFSESQVFSRKKDFAQALTLLKVVEEQIKKALAGAPAARPVQPPAAAAPAAPPKAADGDPAAGWKAKLAEWTPAIKAALAAKGPNAAAVGKLLAQATALSKPGGDMPQALAHLTECHALATAGAATAAPPKADGGGEAPAAPPKAAGGDPAAEFKARLAEWTPAIKVALAAKGPAAAAVGKLLAQATALSKPGGDMAQALAKLTECHALATGRTVAGEALDAGAAGKPAAGADPAAEWKKNLAAWTPAIKAALAAKGPNAAAVGKLLAQATALSKPGGDVAQALAKLTECHALATAGAATPAQTPAARWEAARAVAVAKLQDEIKAVVATKDPDAGGAELELMAVLKQLKGKMETQQQATEMERYLKEDDVVAAVCEMAFDLKSLLLNVLAEIAPRLSASA